MVGSIGRRVKARHTSRGLLFVFYTVRAKVEGFILWGGEADVDKLRRGVCVAVRRQALDPTLVQDFCQSAIISVGEVGPWPILHGVLQHLGCGNGDLVVGKVEVIDRVDFLAQHFEGDTV